MLIVVLSAPIFPALVRGGIAYTLQDLGTIPGGNDSLALGLNDQGEVVGTSTIGTDSRAFLYSNGTMIQLPTAGLAPAWAQGINDAGLVVGIVGTSITSDAQPFVYSTSTGLSLLPIQAAAAFSVNQSGQIVGGFTPPGIPGTPFLGFLASADGQYQVLQDADNVRTVPVAINNSGEIVGNVTNANLVTVPFTLSNGTYQTLSEYWTDSTATAVNDEGMVVGWGSDGAGGEYGFVYDDGVSHQLGDLGEPVTQAKGINDAGLIVGQSRTADGQDHGFVYFGGTMYDLNNLVVGAPGYTVTDAAAINASGQIAGTVLTPSGRYDAVLLTPTSAPLPPMLWSAVTMIVGCIGVLKVRRATHRA